MKKIIAFTGSFNPVTIAHYKLLSDAVEKINADEGVFIATNGKYLQKKLLVKAKIPSSFMLSENLRKEMLSSLHEENEKLNFWGFEIGGASPNTFATLNSLYKKKKSQYKNEEVKLYYLCGADKIGEIPHWKNVDSICDLCEILVYARHLDLDAIVEKDEFLRKNKEKIHFLQVENDELEDVSSTEIRRRFFAGEDYSNLMAEAPYKLMKNDVTPADFPMPTFEEVVEAILRYDGLHRANGRKKIYNGNLDLFDKWDEKLFGNREKHCKAIVYNKELVVNKNWLVASTTHCENRDIVEVAKELIDEGLNPAILNSCSGTRPCLGYRDGENTNECNLCLRSTLSQSLLQFGNSKYKEVREYGLPLVQGVYPLDDNFGGIYSPCVTFFRENEKNYYCKREKYFDCAVISVAPLCYEEMVKKVSKDCFEVYKNFVMPGIEIIKNKIRTIFRIALENGHDSLVLDDFGCKDYDLDCWFDVAKLFQEVLEESEFSFVFKKIFFAIDEGKETIRSGHKGRNGRYKSFYKCFA